MRTREELMKLIAETAAADITSLDMHSAFDEEVRKVDVLVIDGVVDINKCLLIEGQERVDANDDTVLADIAVLQFNADESEVLHGLVTNSGGIRGLLNNIKADVIGGKTYVYPINDKGVMTMSRDFDNCWWVIVQNNDKANRRKVGKNGAEALVTENAQSAVAE